MTSPVWCCRIRRPCSEPPGQSCQPTKTQRTQYRVPFVLDALRDPAKFKSWILRIVVNNCYDLCRKYRPITDLSEVQNFLPADDPDPTERLSLWEAVLSLNPEMRSVVTLFYYDGFSIREISRTLGISDVAVKTRLSRSRKQLRLLLADEQGGIYGSI